uniref:TonB dependent receptor n=2 Tax=Candidatus Kentrum eta TaxID=2126337 RepID=A0A450V9Q0_9GAMM|nr:MAG: TonB dependent receptor [Candidatus Kentron sp. H]VFK01490.1 MAG: TonB dependent receptor [Candidatus Kentron sp. H]
MITCSQWAFDYQDDKVDSTSAYAVTARDNKGLFAQYQGTLFSHDAQLSLRRDDNAQFGNQMTGGAAWGYAFSEGLRLTASYGTAFKAPTLNELYWPYSTYAWNGVNYIEQGNPDLSPEKSKTAELGLRYAPDAGTRVSVSAYETRIRNLIDWASSETGANEITWAPTNTDHARIRGFEAALATRIRGWNLDANLTLLDPRNRSSGENEGNVLPKRARQSWRLDAERRFGNYTIGGTVFAEGARYDDDANTHRLSGYVTFDLRAEYAFAKDWRVQARLENLFDKDYGTAAAYGKPYNQPGRGLFVTVRYRP